MGRFFDRFRKKKEENGGGGQEGPVLYEESGGVTKAQAAALIQGLAFSPAQSPMSVSGGEHDYALISYPGYILIFFHGDDSHLMKIPFREFMPLECIQGHAEFYASQGDFHAAAYCIKEGLEQNQDKEDNWGLHYMAGDIFSQLRRMSPDPKEQKQYLILAYKSYLTSHQCTDCDHKAHVLCKAAAVASILRDPDLAFALYNRAMEEEPDNLEVPHDLGGFLWDMGELDKAAEHYFSVLNRDSSYFDTYEELSNLFRQLGDTTWPKPFMDCFTQKRPLPADQLAAAQRDMTALLAQNQK